MSSLTLFVLSILIIVRYGSVNTIKANLSLIYVYYTEMNAKIKLGMYEYFCHK